MNIDEFMQQVSSFKGVSNVSKIRNNTVKLDLSKEDSLAFFISLESDFEHCSLISAIDNQPDFELVYHFSCMNQSIVVDDSDCAVMLEAHVYLKRDSPSIDSISNIWFGANWHEREAFDLMGIYFIGHPDLRRVLLPEGFAGHPLRKDYVYEIHEEEW
jgi:NADH-quinone oxidoreductase subunit C|tara:strand:+ start:3350 stop:3823 length:474 start_codon:yes stop_codon:yes gene_type:complete